MSSVPRISVLIPTFNSEKNIEQCIRSVLSQTYPDYEVVIVDDSSRDRTRDIINSFTDSRIRILNGPNDGLAEALNFGIRECKGEYIARLDSDDFSETTRFQKQIDYLDSHPNVAVCGTWQRHFGKDNYIHKPASDPEQCKANLLYTCDLCHSTLMIRRQFLIDNNLFYSKDHPAEDFELWTRVLDYADIANIPEILGSYRHEDNITTQKKDRLIFDQMEIVAASLKNKLGIELSNSEKRYFVGCINPFFEESVFPDIFTDKDYHYELLKNVIRKISSTNEEVCYYDQHALINTLGAVWRLLRYKISFYVIDMDSNDIESIFNVGLISLFRIRVKQFNYCNHGFFNKCRKLIRFGIRKITFNRFPRDC